VEQTPSAASTHDYRRLLRYSYRHRGKIVVILLCALALSTAFAGSVTLLLPAAQLILDRNGLAALRDEQTVKDYPALGRALDALLAILPDQTTADGRFQTIVLLTVLLLALTLFKGLFRYTQDYLVAQVGASVAQDLRDGLYARTIRQDLSLFNEAGAAKMMTRFTVDIQQMDRGVRVLYGLLTREPVKAVFMLGVALLVSWQLTLMGLLVVPLVGLSIYMLGQRIKRATRRVLGHTSFLNNILQETFLGIPIVKAFAMEDYETRRFAERNGRLTHNQIRAERTDAASDPITELLAMTAVSAVAVASAWYVVYQGWPIRNYVLLFGAMVALYDPARKLSGVNNRIQQAAAAARRVFELIDAPVLVAERPDARVLPRLTDGLRLRDVRFRYAPDAPEALRGVTFDVHAGETVAIVGHSGAGKTTLVNLLLRFYDPTAGAIEIDGHDLREVTLRSLRGQIALVTQSVVLFEDTVANNIAYGRHEAPREDVIAAAKAANAHDFISQLPQGYDTLLGERGESLSGGQRARLAIARAVFRDPAILILDEATANLDSESEALIQDALERLAVGRTTLIIAHRLSTVKRAARVVVLHEGRVEGQGPHHQLLESCRIYKSLYSLQFGSADGDAGGT
jgi:subfamily B ATP-binding cassette protein MsbA